VPSRPAPTKSGAFTFSLKFLYNFNRASNRCTVEYIVIPNQKQLLAWQTLYSVDISSIMTLHLSGAKSLAWCTCLERLEMSYKSTVENSILSTADDICRPNGAIRMQIFVSLLRMLSDMHLCHRSTLFCRNHAKPTSNPRHVKQQHCSGAVQWKGQLETECFEATIGCAWTPGKLYVA